MTKERRAALPPLDRKAVSSIRPGGDFCARSIPLSAAAHFAWSLSALRRELILCVTDGATTQDQLFQDLHALCPDETLRGNLLFYPGWESIPGHGVPPHADLTGDRFDTLRRLLDPDHLPAIIVAPVQALMQKTLTPDRLRAQVRTFAAGSTIDPMTLLEELDAWGYEILPEVSRKGQAAARGGILDLWPPVMDWPCRIELFGDEIESIRQFDPVEQRSIGPVESVTLSPAIELGLDDESMTGRFSDFLPAAAAWLMVEADSIHHHAELYEHSIGESDAGDYFIGWRELRLAPGRAGHTVFRTSLVEEDDIHTLGYEVYDEVPAPAGLLSPDIMDTYRAQFTDTVAEKLADGWNVHVYFATEGDRARFDETHGGRLSDAIRIDRPLSTSFMIPARRDIHIPDKDFFGFEKQQRRRYDIQKRTSDGPRQTVGERIASWTDIQPGDFVVHVDHGIGIYRGLFEIEFNKQKQEVLTIEYDEGAKLYLPVSQTHLLSRYIGVGKHKPRLHSLGGKRWDKDKVAAEKAVQDLAASLLQTHAVRDAMPGHAYAEDTVWQKEFEASFPYRETPDQEQSIEDVKRDMQNPRPMDRLICGDVGYGKTEVAMRAAFKAVMDGKQVGMLVPTTVLAQQHYDTFRARMAAFPVRIEMLSRFQTRAEQNDIIKRLGEGLVDIVIGTHRLVQDDVQFKDLGLVIIDEEQRFGVKHKEHLKKLRTLVDVLTLTATPIPRTLYMSLTGARDLSVIESPPVERLPIETLVVESRDDIIREAILRELNREGQVYFLHNRVQTIHNMRDRLRRIVPEARIEVAHGQMPEQQLSAIMRSFVRAEFDILLCTTIIESGLDIPNVNTILIDRADRFGMAELYQLRGRVGRYKRRAYAYLLLPKHGILDGIARQRIGAIRQYSRLGSGFKLAMRDLEIRGAGNILGSEQSGHIAAVGFDLYCQLLKRSVAMMKGEEVPPLIDVDLNLDFIDLSTGSAGAENAAVIPVSYIEDETQRVTMYRTIASASTREDVDRLARDIRDRFGRLPPPVERLFILARIRIAAAGNGISRIVVDGDRVIMHRKSDYVMTGGKFPRLHQSNPDRRLRELLKLVRGQG